MAVAETTTGRWDQMRERLLNTPELRERYEATKHAIGLTRALLLRIDDERQRSGLSKAELARRMGASPSVVRRIFSSRPSNPTLRTVLEMLDVLGVEIELKPGLSGTPPERSRRQSARQAHSRREA